MMRELWFWTKVIVCMVAMVMLVLFVIAPVILNVLNRYIITENNSPCLSVTDQTFQCRQSQFEQCLLSEGFTRDECIALVGGSRP